jgi:hypothetical protein
MEKRLSRLNPRAHIGYLTKYDSTNIYGTWIAHPDRGEVISLRDVIFYKGEFYGVKADIGDGLVTYNS